jgi:hypothetical protein
LLHRLLNLWRQLVLLLQLLRQLVLLLQLLRQLVRLLLHWQLVLLLQLQRQLVRLLLHWQLSLLLQLLLLRRQLVLLLQLQSGGVGLNLQHFSKIVFMSPWWTAAMMDQAVGRAVRIGQEKTVEVTMLVLKEEDTMNIDVAMLTKAEGKRSVLERLFLHASDGVEDRPRLRIRIPDNKNMEDELEKEILEEMG